MTIKLGLTTTEVEASLAAHGDNSLTQPPRETFAHKLLSNLEDPIIKILIFALIINIVFVFTGHGDWLETAGIFLAIMLATLVSTYSEFSNESAFQKLQEEASRITCKVWRDGIPTEVPIDKLVVGEAVILQAGDKIPADGYLLEGSVKLDQSALNGESEEAHKEAAPENFAWNNGKIDFLDKYSLYRGSVVVEGQAVMCVSVVGDSSVYGKLTQELKDDDRESPLKLKLSHLAKQISKVGYAGGTLIMLAVMARNVLLAPSFSVYMANTPQVIQDVTNAVILGIIIIVMAVPEGLPLMIALVSSLNMKKMLRDNVLVRKLIGIETAGSLNLLFTDKTGTITKGKLEVVDFLLGDGTSFKSFDCLPEKIKGLTYANCFLNTSAAVTEGKVIGGNMTETALGNYLGDYQVDLGLTKEKFVPFNSSNKYSWVHVTGNGDFCLIKGAPEKLMPAAERYYNAEGDELEFNPDLKRALDAKMVEYAGNSIRMLGLFTRKGLIAGDKVPQNGLRLVGVACIRDDIRPEAVQAIDEVQKAGIQIVMITGDRKETAVAIAKDAGLLKEPTDIAWSSDDLGKMSDAAISEQLLNLRVVARALPMDKSRLVRIAQERGLVVGMTGDGVNDSPALKKADVGFAMGSGTEVAKEAGDIVILDDNFLSIKQAILYGRTIYNSLCKFITFQLSINFSAVFISFLAPFIGVDKPLTITQILWINLIMDTLAALAFGGEPALEKYLEEKPKRREAPIITKKIAAYVLTSGITMTVVSVLFFKWKLIDHLFRDASNHIYTYTGFFCAYVFMAVLNGFHVRTDSLNIFANLEKNKGFMEICTLIIGIQIAMTFIGGRILRVTPLNLSEWGAVVGISLLVLVEGYVFKLMYGHKL